MLTTILLRGSIICCRRKQQVHETTDLSDSEPEQYARMKSLLDNMRTSIMFSRVHETKCQPYAVRDGEDQVYPFGI